MSGIRRCGECGGVFRIENDGPEPLRVDGRPQKHTCAKCRSSKVALLRVLSSLREEDFRFSVEAQGMIWDVYRAVRLGDRPALIAIRLVNGSAEVGAIGESYWNKEKMIEALKGATPS